MNLCYYTIGSCKAESYELESFNLFEAGITTLEEIETEKDSEVTFKFYTNSKEELTRIVAEFPHLNFECGTEEAKDWDLWWRERQTPVKVSKSLWVRPPWINFSAPNSSDVVLALEAKTAFGTGEHISTALAAQLMEEVDFKGKSLLDIGTGTGILSLFAIKKGAKFVVQTDIDYLTIPCLVENYEQNGESDPNAVLGFLDSFNEKAKFDIIVSNMLRTEILPLRSDIERLLAKNGEFILSGQLEFEKHFILDWFKEAGFTVCKELVNDEWWAVFSRLS
ncbi:MAG: 50S ribosomal protein L11 methyltransferase [Fibromonadaceae bacterium]|jgi:ribosomal protein L11 methyltransferase|nr:50S ribosomal protein L11 methyltransferase [Fibromonadaceae bacterium]